MEGLFGGDFEGGRNTRCTLRIGKGTKLKVRLNRIAKGDNLSVMIQFDEEKLLNRVYLWFVVCTCVHPYVPPVKCYKCQSQRFRHVAAVCKGKERCARCRGEHEYGKCGNGVNTVAIVAGPIVQGSVAARSGKRLKKLKFVKVTEGLTYVEAIMRVRREDQQKEQKDSDKTMIKPCDNHCRMNDKTMVVEKIIHAFMAEVINCSAQTDSRSERIRIIIRAAGNLKIEGIAVTMWDWWILMVFILLQWIARS